MPPPRIIYSGSNSTRKRNKKGATSISSLPFILQVLAACYCRLFFLLLLLHLTSSHVNAEQHSTIPRSNNRYTQYTNSISSTDTDDSNSSSSSASSAASDISSTSSPLNKESSSYHPPWNPSPKINQHGFLSEYYPRTPGEWETLANIRGKHGPRNYIRYQKLLNIPVQIRQVPGDGNCLFHSIAATLYYMNHNCNQHLPMDSHASIHELRSLSLALRNSAVDVLANENNINGRRKKLFLQGEEYLEAHELLNAAAAQFDLDGEGYCELMRKESYWGGGPEIVALCNYLQRPIHIYELIPSEEVSTKDDGDNNNNNLPSTFNNIKTSNQFTLRRMACFGSPKFDRREPLHILSADSRFPDVEPRRIRKVGNHFLALFPVNTLRHNSGAEEDGQYYQQQQQRLRRHALIRGGSRIEGDKNNRDKVSNNRSGDDNERSTKGSGNNNKRNNIWQFLGEFVGGFIGGVV